MISIVYDSKRYRTLLRDTVKDGSTVIEIGPHVGRSTSAYVEKTKRTIAVDLGLQSEKAFRKLCERHSNLVFLRADARKFETVKEALKHASSCDYLLLDMGGGRFPDTVFKVWAVWSGVFRPKHSVIRNRGLAEFVQRAKIIDDSLIRDFSDDGWMSVWGRTVPSKLKDQLEEFGLYIKLK